MPEVRRKVVPRAVYFDFDKADIRSDARATLDEAIRLIKEFGYAAVICQGHTDSMGTEEYNEGLSLRRAGSVRDYLVDGGISPSAITIEGFGETRPVATNDTADGRQQNRRVELQVSE
jgi:OOP family OmpA-OmpF porin